MIDIKQAQKLASKYKIHQDIIETAFAETDNKECVADRVLSGLEKSINTGRDVLFSKKDNFYQQFCFSCCHILAEHLVYEMHDVPGIQVFHCQIREYMTIHSCVKLIYKQNTFYLDGEGIFRTIHSALEKYPHINKDAIVISRSGHEIIDQGHNETVRKLSELTDIFSFIDEAKSISGEELDDLEHSALDNIAIAIINH